MKIKSIWLALIDIICFLCIHVGYNKPVDPLFLGLLWIIEEEGITFGLESFPLQFIIIALFLSVASLLQKRVLIIVGIGLLVVLLGFWMYYLYSSAIVFNLFSIVPFAFASLFTIFYLVRYKPKKYKGENNRNPLLF